MCEFQKSEHTIKCYRYSENETERVTRHRVTHTTRGMCSQFRSQWPEEQSHEQITVTEGNAADFVRAAHDRGNTWMKTCDFELDTNIHFLALSDPGIISTGVVPLDLHPAAIPSLKLCHILTLKLKVGCRSLPVLVSTTSHIFSPIQDSISHSSLGDSTPAAP